MAVETDAERNDRRERDNRHEEGGNSLRKRHPLNRPADEIFHLVKDENWFRTPFDYVRGKPKPGKNNLLCEYHNAYGHSTAQCGHLKHQLEILVRKGHLDRFVAGPPGEAPNEQHHDNNGRRHDERERGRGYDGRENSASNRHEEEHGHEEVPQRLPFRWEVHMITGENGVPTSNRAKKQLVKAIQTGHYNTTVTAIDNAANEPTISFGPENARPLMYPHDDALVFSVEVAGYLVHRVFVDSGSAVNILYWDCWKAIGLNATVEPTTAPLYGFSGQSVIPVGMVELPVTLGRVHDYKTRAIRFLIIDAPRSSYNIILGRPALNIFKAVVSTLYLKMKFPMDGGRIGEVWGDQATSKKCHVQALTQHAEPQREHTQGEPSTTRQKRERTSEEPNSRRKEKIGVVTASAPERKEIT